MDENKIEIEKWYSLTEMVKLGLFEWIKSYQAYLGIVMEDKSLSKKDRTLDATIMGEGKGKTIRIKGQNIINFLSTKNQHGKNENTKSETEIQ